MLSIIPVKRTAQSPAFQRPILMRKQRRERMTVKRGVVKIMVRASPRGRKTRLLQIGGIFSMLDLIFCSEWLIETGFLP